MKRILLAVAIAAASLSAFSQQQTTNAGATPVSLGSNERIRLRDSLTSMTREERRERIQELARRMQETRRQREGGVAGATSRPGQAPSLDKGKVYVWAESSANVKRLGSEAGVISILDKMSSAGIDTLILEVKPVHGHVIYPSRIAPRLKKWKGYELNPNFDVIATAVREGKKRNVRVLIGLNVFTEGLQENPDTGKNFGPVFDGHPEWEAWNYAMPENPPAAVEQPARSQRSRRTSSAAAEDTATLKPISKHGKSFATFVTPHNPEVRQYELSIIRELVTKYQPDGVVLDRVRFNNIESDFSKYARQAFEQFIGRKVQNWPEDILTWKRNAQGKPEHVPGVLYQEWLFFRAKTIRDFFREARDMVKLIHPDLVFADYTGSWYGDYWNEGLNWGSPDYDASKDHPWATPQWKETGYADLLDVLFSGFYFKAVTVADALSQGKDKSNSVEGAGQLLEKVVGDDTKYVGGLNLPDYVNEPTQFERAARMCLEKTGGVMIFDLIYLDEYDWWSVVKQLKEPDRRRVLQRSPAAGPVSNRVVDRRTTSSVTGTP